MSKYDVIQKIVNDMPKEYQDGYIVCQSRIMPFPKFLTEIFPNYVNDTVLYENVKNYVVQLFNTKVRNLEDMKKTYIESFIKQNNVNEEIAEWLRSIGINNMNDNFQINYGSGTKSLMNYYELLLNQKNNTPSELDKLEICDNYIHTYLPVELHDFYLEKFGMTIYDFITTKVPEMMFDYYRIEVNGELLNIDEFILDLCSQVIKEKERIDRINLDQINHVNDKPMNVGEIKVELNKDNVLEVTGEIPIIISELNEEEMSSLIEDASIPKENILFELLSNLKTSVYKATNLKTLETLKNILSDYQNKYSNQIKIMNYITSIFELIELKTRSLIIINSNKFDYIDAMYGGLVELDRSNNDIENSSQPIIDFNLIKIKKEMEDKGITDHQLQSTLNKTLKNRNRAQIITTNLEFNRDSFMTETDLEYRLMEIKNQKNAIVNSAYDNNYLAGAQVNLEQKVKDFEGMVNSPSVSNELKDKYITEANNILIMQEEIRRVA